MHLLHCKVFWNRVLTSVARSSAALDRALELATKNAMDKWVGTASKVAVRTAPCLEAMWNIMPSTHAQYMMPTRVVHYKSAGCLTTLHHQQQFPGGQGRPPTTHEQEQHPPRQRIGGTLQESSAAGGILNHSLPGGGIYTAGKWRLRAEERCKIRGGKT